jgi:hypothetical protein
MKRRICSETVTEKSGEPRDLDGSTSPPKVDLQTLGSSATVEAVRLEAVRLFKLLQIRTLGPLDMAYFRFCMTCENYMDLFLAGDFNGDSLPMMLPGAFDAMIVKIFSRTGLRATTFVDPFAFFYRSLPGREGAAGYAVKLTDVANSNFEAKWGKFQLYPFYSIPHCRAVTFMCNQKTFCDGVVASHPTTKVSASASCDRLLSKIQVDTAMRTTDLNDLDVFLRTCTNWLATFGPEKCDRLSPTVSVKAQRRFLENVTYLLDVPTNDWTWRGITPIGNPDDATKEGLSRCVPDGLLLEPAKDDGNILTYLRQQ